MKKGLSIGVLCCSIYAALLYPHASLSQEPASSPQIALVSVPLANVHEQPLPKSRLATQVLMGDEVRLLEKRDYRYHIAIPSQGDQEGWIQQEALFIPKDNGRGYLNSGRKRIIVSAPKTEALILDKTGNHKVAIYAGTELPVIQETATDYKVQLPDHSAAIIGAADAMQEKPTDPLVNDTSPAEIADTAKRFKGVRFLAGGITSQGIDINGLIYITYRIHGIALGRDLSSLAARATRVSKKDLAPGDILAFYGENRGLYLGDGRFLHIVRKGTVQVGGVYDRRFSHSLQHGVRIIGADPDAKKIPAAMSADEILLEQARIADLPLGKRIAYWAARFIGTPYDTDPLGWYVRSNHIVADDKVDCMYHTFRSVELARSSTPGEAIDRALSLRFITAGRLADGLVTNYNDRFQYGEDMVFSGKWGRNITADLGETRRIPGSRGRDEVDILPKSVLATRALQAKLQDGDILYWVKDPNKRVVEEIVAHLSIVHVKAGRPYLIHAAGSKNQWGTPDGGAVKEVPFSQYVRKMHFIGAFVTRFEQ